MQHLPSSPSRACADDLPQLAAAGLARAQAARAQMQTLSAEQVQAVSGGALMMFDDWCGTVPLKFKFGGLGGGVLGGDRPPIINGQYGDILAGLQMR
jgi:hypothetical protein